MSTRQVVALLCFIIAAVLAVIAVAVSPAQGKLLSLALAAVALGLAVEATS